MAIEKKISHLIQKDFPAYYRDEGPQFVEFLRVYYEWLESEGQMIYHARNLLDYKDIDTTIDDFIVYFKQKYLPSIQFDTATDVQQLIKHSLDLYRSKGTDRSIDLFFRLVYGKPAELYYPGQDIFRLSDGKWVKPVYLELTYNPKNRDMINKQIVGLTSGATAFVERVIRRKIASKYAEIMFISSVNGNFQTGEKITIQGAYQQDNPTVLGSLTVLDIISGGQDFVVGEIVDVSSPNGVQGKGRVATVAKYTGLVDFRIIDSGWGFSPNAEVLVSEKVLSIGEVTPVANSIRPFIPFESITQPLANITYNAANSIFQPNDMIYSYYTNNMVAGVGRVLLASNSSTSNGTMKVAVLQGTIGLVPEKNVNATATVVVSRYSDGIYGVKHNTNLTGTAMATFGRRSLNGTGTRFDKELFKPQANLTGTVSVDSTSNSVVGTGTRFDKDLFEVTANLTGQVSVNTTSLSVIGEDTLFINEFIPGEYIALYSNSTNYEARKIDNVVNSTYLVVNSAFTFVNSYSAVAQANLNPHLSVYVTESYWESRGITRVTNATHLVVKTRFFNANTSAKYANTVMDQWISVANSSYREIRLVNNVINSTALWLKWPLDFANSTATVGNVTPSNTKFIVPFVNAVGTISFSNTSKQIVASGNSFSGFGDGDLIALYSNSTTYELKVIDKITNSTHLTLTNVTSFSNSSGIYANVTANDGIFFGKTLIFHANSTSLKSGVVESVANDSYLVLRDRPDFDNSNTTFANATTISRFYKAGNSAIANATNYVNLTATANIIGFKANVELSVTDNALRFTNGSIVYQTNSTGFETANGRIISVSYTGTNTFMVVNSVSGAFQPNSTLRAKLSNGELTSSNGKLINTQYFVGVKDIDNVFTANTGNFIYTSANTRGVVTRVSQHNVQAGFSISSNSLAFDETITFYGDPIFPYRGVYLNADFFEPPGSNLTSNVIYANIDTKLVDAFTNSTIVIGGINTLVSINPGTDYDTAPVVVIYEPYVASAGKRDYIIRVSNSSGVFIAGEVVTQNSAVVGVIKAANSTVLNVKRIRYETPFANSIALEGLASGATANIVLIEPEKTALQIGINSIIEANIVASSGSVSSLEVVDSGVGYLDNETVSFVSKDGIRAGQAVARLYRQGVAEGFYTSRGGFLSADKKIFDGHYYQEYSYEIRSPITLDKYENMLRNVLHVAGTKFFASVVTPSVDVVSVDIKEAVIGISGRITANTTLNSNSVTANTKLLRVGDRVSGLGLRANSTIRSINSTAFVMNNTANSTQVGTTVTYSR